MCKFRNSLLFRKISPKKEIAITCLKFCCFKRCMQRDVFYDALRQIRNNGDRQEKIWQYKVAGIGKSQR
ncbi:MAG: hypothetical protein DRH32_04725 [Deltaproteobacteria bacterium]|nr:MAG: hypothetical protein DRH32_04725 [Deltaproteobacteria bacterium]